MKKYQIFIFIIFILLLSSCSHVNDKSNNENNINVDNEKNTTTINENSNNDCDCSLYGLLFESFNEAKELYYDNITSNSNGDMILLNLDLHGFFTDGYYELIGWKKIPQTNQISAFQVSIQGLYYTLGYSYCHADNNNERTKSDKKILIECNQFSNEIPSFDINDYEISLRNAGCEFIENGETIIYKGYNQIDEKTYYDYSCETEYSIYTGSYVLSYNGKNYCEFNFFCEENSIEYVKDLILNNIVILHR